MEDIYKNLVFEGGGVKGIAYAGALEVLQENGLLSGIKRVAGTSAGAITACLVAIGYTPEEIKQHVFDMDFRKFEDGWDPLRLPAKYGLYKGDTFLEWIKGLIKKKVHISTNATFGNLREQGLKDLYVYATDLNIFDIKQFSADDTPNVVVAEAVRASMSIPLFFKAWKFTSNNPDNHVYVDGGVVLNYPLNVFDTVTTIDDPQTLGFYLFDKQGLKSPSNLNYDEPIGYCKCLFETMLDAQDIDFSLDECMQKRTVKIDDYGILATDFAITDVQKNQLYESGKKYTKAYLDSIPDLAASVTS
ncbi:MAG: patatin-like phospholipase family protein [Janthinobacterium lividum]